MKISEIVKYLESISPLALQEDYDNSGLLLGDPAQEINKVLVCLDVTPEVMDEASGNQCSLVISHHPFIFRGIRKIVPGMPETPVIRQAIKNDIAIYAIHTNLDNTFNGLNALVLKKVGIEKYRILRQQEGMLLKLAVFCPADHAERVRKAIFDAGAGEIGNYDCCSYNMSGEGTFRASDKANPFVGEKNSIHVEKETRIEVIFPRYLELNIIRSMLAMHPYEEVAYDLYPLKNSFARAGAGLVGELAEPIEETVLLEQLKQQFNNRIIRHSPLRGKPVKSIAICTGSGAFLIQDAIRAGADMFLTADLKYHDFFGMESRILLADIGHYESEHWVKEWLYDALNEKFPKFAVLISNVNTNPVNYF